MKRMLFLLSFVLFGACMTFSVFSSESEAKIYFTNWNYRRRSSLTEVDVRQNPDIYIHITDGGEVNRLKACLTLNLIEDFERRMNHVDIVIDIISNGQIIETYIINKFSFCKKGSDRVYITPETILRKYTFYGETRDTETK